MKRYLFRILEVNITCELSILSVCHFRHWFCDIHCHSRLKKQLPANFVSVMLKLEFFTTSSLFYIHLFVACSSSTVATPHSFAPRELHSFSKFSIQVDVFGKWPSNFLITAFFVVGSVVFSVCSFTLKKSTKESIYNLLHLH